MNAIELENKYGCFNYKPLPVVLAKGEGVWLWDEDGKKYLDMMSAYSAVSHGHSHPRLVKIFQEQAGNLAIVSRAFYNTHLGPYEKKLCEITRLDRVLPMNTGAEGVETAIKASRLWGYKVKNIPEGKAEIITAEGNFHGRTTTIIGFSSDFGTKDGFAPFTDGFKTVPFGDAEAIAKAITPNTCAVLIEPVQGEAGIIVPPKGYLKKIREICDKNNVLMVLDEVQSGLGRTGKLFCFNHEDITPDLVILGKALGGGMMPVSAVVGKDAVLKLFTPGSHGSTFGGNPLAARVALEAINVLQEEGLVDNSAKLGKYFVEKLKAIKTPLFKEIRGIGLWIGAEFYADKADAKDVCLRLMKKGILAKETHKTTIRFAPPLVITKEQIDWAVEQIESVLKEVENA
ncbi:MAG: ornithine--oxo-acid transaminase [Alphaproteobacteria bacterium]